MPERIAEPHSSKRAERHQAGAAVLARVPNVAAMDVVLAQPVAGDALLSSMKRGNGG